MTAHHRFARSHGVACLRGIEVLAHHGFVAEELIADVSPLRTTSTTTAGIGSGWRRSSRGWRERFARARHNDSPVHWTARRKTNARL